MHLTGRLFLACVFSASAYDKFLRVPGEVQVVTSLHIPAPRTVLVLVGVFETLGALALVIGIYARQPSVLLALFMVVISLAVLRFWSPAGGGRSARPEVERLCRQRRHRRRPLLRHRVRPRSILLAASTCRHDWASSPGDHATGQCRQALPTYLGSTLSAQGHEVLGRSVNHIHRVDGSPT
jgi:hypothetical protein